MRSNLILKVFNVFFDGFFVIVQNDKTSFGQFNVVFLFLDFLSERFATIFVGVFLFFPQFGQLEFTFLKFLYFYVVLDFIGFLFWFFGHFWNFGVVSDFGLIILETELVSEPTLFILISGFFVIISIVLVIVIVRVVVVII